jgi:hypothetical protein
VFRLLSGHGARQGTGHGSCREEPGSKAQGVSSSRQRLMLNDRPRVA